MINPLLSNAEQHSQGFLVDNQNMAGIFTEATPVQKAVESLDPQLLRALGAAYGLFLVNKAGLRAPTAVNKKKNITIDYLAAALVGLASPVFGSLGMLLYLNMSKGKK